LVGKGEISQVHKNQLLNDAAEEGHLEKVKYFLSLGADIHNDKDYPLRSAINRCRKSVVHFLLLAGADASKVWPRQLLKYLDPEFLLRASGLVCAGDPNSEKSTPPGVTGRSNVGAKDRNEIILVRPTVLFFEKKREFLTKIRTTVTENLSLLLFKLYYRPTGPAFNKMFVSEAENPAGLSTKKVSS